MRMTAAAGVGLVLLASVSLAGAAWQETTGDDRDKLKVGVQLDGRIVVPTNQILKPAGTQVTFPGRPVDLQLLDGGKTLVVHNKNNLLFIDTATAKVTQTLASPVGLSVIGLVVDGSRIFTSDVKDHVRVAKRQADGTYKWAEPWPLDKPKVDGAAHPAGMILRGKELWVTSSRGNSVQRLDTTTGKVVQVVPVGVAPFTILFPNSDTAYVSNWGGDAPDKDDPQAPSSKTPVKIDPRTGVANHGSVSVLRAVDGQWQQVKSIPVGLHPSGMTVSKGGKFLYVANASSDTVSVIDAKTDAVVETIKCRPDFRLPFGSGCNALALSPDGSTLYVANGSNNCVTVVRLGKAALENAPAEVKANSTLAGLIPTGWYPGGIRVSGDGQLLYVANIKGHGSLGPKGAKDKDKNSHQHLGSVSIIDVPGGQQLAKYTEQVNDNNRLAYSLAGLEKARPGAKAVPVPARHGEPSVFEHVIYIIKENRTYDQVFGDLKEGNGEPKLVMFGEKVTPNLHALARQFTLFDNFYCSGVLSADGHSWCNEAYCTDYLERSFGGFTRSYPYEGSDPLAFAPCGFLWDNALLHKKTFRNYGEFCRTTYTPAKATWSDTYADFMNGTNNVKITVTPNMATLDKFSHPNYPGFPLRTPDVYRAKLFLEDLRAYEKKGEFPNLTYIFLPNDHTSGTTPDFPTPEAMVADNDLAVGRIVEAVSKSKFWAKTCIFIVEDDPQNGFDHVDGHRTIAFVLSPYTKRKFVDHTNYNQTGMVKTMELILGLPPMNQLDLSATAMRQCFQDTPDLTPYTALPNNIPLDTMNPPTKNLTGKALYWAKKSIEMKLTEVDEADEDTFNRLLWFATRGEEAYPDQYIGRRAPGREGVVE